MNSALGLVQNSLQEIEHSSIIINGYNFMETREDENITTKNANSKSQEQTETVQIINNDLQVGKSIVKDTITKQFSNMCVFLRNTSTKLYLLLEFIGILGLLAVIIWLFVKKDSRYYWIAILLILLIFTIVVTNIIYFIARKACYGNCDIFKVSRTHNKEQICVKQSVEEPLKNVILTEDIELVDVKIDE